ncbi:MAG: Mrp/NBP35 family ATP-binding protein [Anaerolineales bacterium]|nr:Mrp/NBP35 family ATP-binding protein [Anaerolineales bacterium]
MMTEKKSVVFSGALSNEHSRIQSALAVASGKGGVGKSTTAVNLAIAFTKMGLKVGLMDADIYGPNIPTMMGVTSMPDSTGLNITPAQAHGIKLVSIGLMVRPDQALIWRGPMLHNAIRQFVEGVAWGDLDILVIDLPPGTGDAQLSLAQVLKLSGGIIVTLPQNVSLEDARRGMEMFRKMDIPILGVVENMSYLDVEDGTRMDIFGSGGGERLAREGDVTLLGSLPIDARIRVGGDSGIPISVSAPESEPAILFTAMAEKIHTRLSELSREDPGVSIEMLD